MKLEPVIGQLLPINDCVLVELQQSHKNFTTKEGKYDTRTEGIVVAIPEHEGAITVQSMAYNMAKPLIGKRVHFEEFKEGARIKRNGKIFSFIKISDIRGYEIV